MFDAIKAGGEGAVLRVEGKIDFYQGRLSPKLTKATVQGKATQLRKLGIPLKKFKGVRHHINVDEALVFLAKIRGSSVATLKKEAEASAKKRARRRRA